MKKILLLISLLIVGCSKDELIPTSVSYDDEFILDETTNNLHENILLSVNISNFNSQINWNDHKKQSQTPIYINGDDIPDIIAPLESNDNDIKSKVVQIIDYKSNPIYTFDIYDYNPNIRDSLPVPMVSFNDLNSDGHYDFVISYMGEYHNGNDEPIFTGTNSYLWLSKGELQFDVIELYDSRIPQFGVTTFDFDQDGYVDILPFAMQDGKYYKNINNEQFVLTDIEPIFISEGYSYFDWNNDGILDFVNIGPHNKMITIITNSEIIKIPFENTGWDFYFTVEGNSEEWLVERSSIIDGDNDGDWDLVLGGFYDNNGTRYYEQKYFQNNNNQYTYIENYIEHDHSLNGMLKVWISDIDNDGDSDMYYPTYGEWGGEEKVFWWENVGNSFKINKNFKLIY